MTYADTARRFVLAEQSTRAGAAPTPEALAADHLPMSEWAEARRDTMSPQTIAANHAMHVRGVAQDLRVAVSHYERMITDEPSGTVANLAAAATALLAAIGEAHA